jgi:hypothetical protein
MRWATLALFLATTACSFHSTATHWNGMYDADGKPVFVKTTTNVGFNLLILLPIAGNTTIDSMIDETTAEIAREGGSRVRLVQSGSENYWYGWSPFTWVLTPVVTDVVIEYEPSKVALDAAMADNRAAAQRHRQRAQGDNTHIVPGPRDQQPQPQADAPLSGAEPTVTGRHGG